MSEFDPKDFDDIFKDYENDPTRHDRAQQNPFSPRRDPFGENDPFGGRDPLEGVPNEALRSLEQVLMQVLAPKMREPKFAAEFIAQSALSLFNRKVAPMVGDLVNTEAWRKSLIKELRDFFDRVLNDAEGWAKHGLD